MEMLIVNPRKRGSKRKHVAKRKGRKHNPARRHRKSSKRSYRRKNPSHVVRRTHRAKRRSSSRRRNPISVSGVKHMLMPAVWGGGGAVLTDIAYRLLPVPGALSILKGTLSPVTKVGVALLTAGIAKHVVGASRAHEMLSGSLAVIAYGLINSLVLSRLPVISAPAPGTAGYELSYGNAGAVVQGSGFNSALPDTMSEYVHGGGMSEYVGDYSTT